MNSFPVNNDSPPGGSMRISNGNGNGQFLHVSEFSYPRTISPSFQSSHNVVNYRREEPGPHAQSESWFRSRSQNGDVESHPPSGSVRSISSVASSNSQRGDMPWFHAAISRDATERLLQGKPDGTFLVRDSTNFPGDFTLSMTYRMKVEHYRIYLERDGQLTCDHEEFFPNLMQLISHYKRDADGLCHRLITPIVCESFRSLPGDVEDRTSVFLRAGLVIPSGDISIGEIIGHGEFGDVRLGMHKSKRVAMKVSKRHGSGMVNNLLDEARFMVGLSHPNLVALVGVVLDDSNVYMVTEFMANGNLVDFLRSRGRHQIEKNQLCKFSVDICAGMTYLETCKIVHRDLAARNILLDDDLVAKISDFGLAKKLNVQSPDGSSGKFPIKWTAPEALRNSNFSSKSDMWSFGVLLWEIFSFGRVPYPRIGADGRSPIQDVVRHIERGYRMEAPEGCPPEFVRVMHDAWALKPEDRPSFAETLQRLHAISRSSTNANF